jgi:hypothetical protein
VKHFGQISKKNLEIHFENLYSTDVGTGRLVFDPMGWGDHGAPAVSLVCIKGGNRRKVG